MQEKNMGHICPMGRSRVKHNFHKENETFSKKKLKRFNEKSLKMEPFLSELPYHIYD